MDINRIKELLTIDFATHYANIVLDNNNCIDLNYIEPERRKNISISFDDEEFMTVKDGYNGIHYFKINSIKYILIKPYFLFND